MSAMNFENYTHGKDRIIEWILHTPMTAICVIVCMNNYI